jgi:hypothetical protein
MIAPAIEHEFAGGVSCAVEVRLIFNHSGGRAARAAKFEHGP